MNLGADVMGDEPHDALAVGCGETLAGIDKPPDSRSTQSRPSGLSMTSTTPGSSSQAGDRRSERGAQHACATRDRLGLKGMNCHACPQGRRDIELGGGDQ